MMPPNTYRCAPLSRRPGYSAHGSAALAPASSFLGSTGEPAEWLRSASPPTDNGFQLRLCRRAGCAADSRAVNNWMMLERIALSH